MPREDLKNFAADPHFCAEMRVAKFFEKTRVSRFCFFMGGKSGFTQ